jgi:putative GTP pyrophosphokinase
MANESGRLVAFLEAYEAYVKQVLQPTQAEIRKALEPWQEPDHWEKYKRTSRIPIPTPVRMTLSRIKRPEQVVDKISRKPWRFPAGLQPESFRAMHDTIGVRVVVFFLSHLPLIDRELRGSDVFEISDREPPMAYMSAAKVKELSLNGMRQEDKESGYSSLHYCLRLRRSVVPDGARPWFEMQVRTMSQELWCAMEHHLGYKPGKRTNVTSRRQFKILSAMIGAIDDHFNLLYDELNRYQEEQSYEENDPLDVENLPPVLAEAGISCAQRDINNILKFLYSRGVELVADFRDVATPRRLTMIRNTFLSVSGRLPTNLETIATLAAIRGAEDEAEEYERIRSQIAFRGAWDTIKQEFRQD